MFRTRGHLVLAGTVMDIHHAVYNTTHTINTMYSLCTPPYTQCQTAQNTRSELSPGMDCVC